MIAWFATKGSGTNEARRMEALLSRLPETMEIPFDKQRKKEGFLRILAEVRRLRPRLLVMEGSGIAGGGACLLARLLYGTRYVVSSGDAIGPFIGSHQPWLGPLFGLYERLLCRWSAGFIGWTPYLAGRAMTFGAPRAMTAPGGNLGGSVAAPGARGTVRARYGVAADHLVFGIVGALEWNPAKRYCYGLELVRAIRQVKREDVSVLIIGGGSGLERLREEAGPLLGRRVFLPGPVPLEGVADALAAMDVASLPQSMDPVGMFRYTTKISEYAAARLPVVTARIPMAYDLDRDWIWRLPGSAPWGETYCNALARRMESITRAEIEATRARIPDLTTLFDAEPQCAAAGAFIADLLEEETAE